MSDNVLPSSKRIVIGGSDPRGTNTEERYQNALIRYGKQSFGIYWEVFRDLEIKEGFLKPYKPSEAKKLAARDNKFIEKDLFNLIDSSKKIVDDFKMLRPKMTAFVLQSITPAREEKIKERYRPEWVKAINQLCLLDRKILQVGATHLPARDQVYMVIMKLKEHKNLAIIAKNMEYLSRMNKEDFPTSRDEVLETFIDSNLTLDGTNKTSNKLPSVLSTSKDEPEKGPKIISFTDGSHGFARPDGLYEVFVIDAKGKFIKNKTIKGKKTKKGISIIEDKTIADSTKEICNQG